MELYTYILGSFSLEEAIRLITIEGYFGIGSVMTNRNIVLICKIDDLTEELEVADGASRVIRVVYP
jgi:hypothetical protein